MKYPLGNLRNSLIAGMVLVSPAAYADKPQDFLRHAMEGDNSEIMLGSVAAKQAESPRVREFGQMLQTDHSQALDEVMQVARRMRVGGTHDVAPEARQERHRLADLHGREFDREFIRYMVDDHRKDVSDFREEANEHHGPVSELAQRQLPTLQKHLDMAMALDRDRGGRGRGDQDSRNQDMEHGHRDNNGDTSSDRETHDPQPNGGR